MEQGLVPACPEGGAVGGHLNGELLLSVTESLCGAGDGIVLATSVSFVGECRLWRVLSLCSNETCASKRFPPLFFLQSATAARLCVAPVPLGREDSHSLRPAARVQ